MQEEVNLKLYIMCEPTLLERTLDRVRDYRNYRSNVKLLDKMVAHIQENKAIYTRLVFTTALLLMTNNKFALAEPNNYKELDNLYFEILRLGSKFGKISCIGGGVFEVSKAALKDGDNKAATKIIIKYLLIYATIGILDMGFKIVDDTFLQNRI